MNPRTLELRLSLHPSDSTKLLAQPVVLTKADNQTVFAPQHLVFIIDRSGSMSGEKLSATKQAVIKIIDETLTSRDTFDVILFNNEATVLSKHIKKDDATQLNAAISEIQNIKADGNTAMESALRKVGDLIDDVSKDRQITIVLLTDGDNNNPIDVPGETTTIKAKGIRIIPVGIGVTYNTALLSEIGMTTGVPATVHISDDDANDITEKFKIVASLFRPSTAPVSVKLTVDGKDFECDYGCTFVGQEASRVMPISIPNNKASFTCTVEISVDKKSDIREETEIHCNQFTLQEDIVALYVNQEIAELGKQLDKPDTLQKLRRLKQSLNLNQSSHEFTKNVASNLNKLILAAKEQNEDLRRQVVAETSLNSLVPTQRGQFSVHVQQNLEQGQSAPVAINPTTNLIAQYDKQKKTLEVGTQSKRGFRSHSSYQVIDQTINMADFGTSTFVTLHPDLGSREILTVDEKDAKLDADYEDLIDRLGFSNKKIADAMPLVNKLEALADYNQVLFPSVHQDAVKEIIEKEADKVLLNQEERDFISLSHFLGRAGLCRHQALATAIFLIKLIKEDVIEEGSVRLIRGENKEGTRAHMVVVYTPKKGPYVHQRILIDSTQTEQKTYVLTDPPSLEALRDVYTAQGLDGMFDHFFVTAKLIESPATIINEHCLMFSRDEIKKKLDRFGTVGEQYHQALESMLCPISQEMMKDPVWVRLANGGLSHDTYDRESIAAWTRTHDTDPMTHQQYQTPIEFVLNDELLKQVTFFLYLAYTNKSFMLMAPSLSVAKERTVDGAVKECEKATPETINQLDKQDLDNLVLLGYFDDKPLTQEKREEFIKKKREYLMMTYYFLTFYKPEEAEKFKSKFSKTYPIENAVSDTKLSSIRNRRAKNIQDGIIKLEKSFDVTINEKEKVEEQQALLFKPTTTKRKQLTVEEEKAPEPVSYNQVLTTQIENHAQVTPDIPDLRDSQEDSGLPIPVALTAVGQPRFFASSSSSSSTRQQNAPTQQLVQHNVVEPNQSFFGKLFGGFNPSGRQNAAPTQQPAQQNVAQSNQWSFSQWLSNSKFNPSRACNVSGMDEPLPELPKPQFNNHN